jgi:hypothetical protein
MVMHILANAGNPQRRGIALFVYFEYNGAKLPCYLHPSSEGSQTHDDGLTDDSIPHQTVAIKRRFVFE